MKDNIKYPKSIEEVLFPDVDKLKIDKNGNLTATIVDAELDPIECEFNDGDRTVQLNTKDVTYVMLTYDNLVFLMDKLDQAEKYQQNLNDGGN